MVRCGDFASAKGGAKRPAIEAAGTPRAAHEMSTGFGEVRRRAVSRGDRSPRREPGSVPSSRARTCCTGEWLRREGRRVDAREQLRAAQDASLAIGMEAFAERARKELLATGEKARKRTVETRDDLTAQERQIAQMARDGPVEPGDRRAAVPQPAHRGVAPAQGVRKARDPLARRSSPTRFRAPSPSWSRSELKASGLNLDAVDRATTFACGSSPRSLEFSRLCLSS